MKNIDDKKICFISAVNDDLIYNECIFYIKNLIVPKGYEIEIIDIKNAKSITSAYNSAMKKTNARYKVYLHQDLFIINKNFLNDIISIFENKNIGMIGLIGSKTIPDEGIWWNSPEIYGSAYDNADGKSMRLLNGKYIKNNFEKVLCIDGLIMITQYDMPWRDDIFDGWHFYDVSQSMEFNKLGYDVVVSNQDKPWCIHDCGRIDIDNNSDYYLYRDKFLNEYKNFTKENKLF